MAKTHNRLVKSGRPPSRTCLAVYTNHMTADQIPDRVRDGYGNEKYERLSVLKAKYDPDNFFHLNHNIPPRRP